ncbi:hypothetical protein NG798_27175 [Ancylothrix sp. C2]|uniref:hypothetical protein n=1 Tax=Ancylothrix sp. D3o TaxID=2953691 RepID=UPI0021BA7F3B|nr:hypothetical protein [Ancylothrix sp. D3o]MCT7953486.1 hypothetical protein [Ancylothrix sp. D3o]
MFSLTDVGKCHKPAFCIGARGFYAADGFLGVGECSEADEFCQSQWICKGRWNSLVPMDVEPASQTIGSLETLRDNNLRLPK